MTALSGSLFIYLAHWEVDHALVHTVLGLLFLYLLLPASAAVWFWTGFFSGTLWFWWIGLSFVHYRMSWAIPFVILAIGLGYGVIFWLIAKIALGIERWALSYRDRSFSQEKPTKTLNSSLLILHSVQTHGSAPTLFTMSIKSLGLLMLSYLHPFGFDWYKPELIFVESWVGIAKWQFAVVLGAATLALWKKQPLFLLLTLVAYDPLPSKIPAAPDDIAIISTDVSVEEKWDRALQPKQHSLLLEKIDHAIATHKKVVILPESVFALFLNRQPILFEALKKRAKKINIVTGALYWDGKSPKNSTYIFTRDGNVTLANKVILVPFGERNPLPDFLGKWVNKIFYDDAVDYTADKHVTDYTIEGITYRNAICFEATSERLYVGSPKQMIVLSNNGWFVPSTEPILQRLLLQYYSQKYGTTIYHAVNMSKSYIVIHGHIFSFSK